MPSYIIKSVCIFEIEADNDQEAIKAYDEGLWNQDDIVDEKAFELGEWLDDEKYIVIKED